MPSLHRAARSIARLLCCMLLFQQMTGHAGEEKPDTLKWSTYQDGPPQLNQKEQALWKDLYAGQKSCMKHAKDEALDVAAKEAYQGTELNGPGDAVRHCVWSCEMTRCLGEDRAKQWGDAHEDNNAPPAEKKMDLENNATGRKLWGSIWDKAQPTSYHEYYNGKCKDACEQALRDKRLKVLAPELWR